MKPSKLFMDMEFTGLHKNTSLISIGIVADTGQFFYAEFTDYIKAQLNSWIIDNVINNLVLPPSEPNANYFSWDKDNNAVMQGTHLEISKYISDWLQGILGGPMTWVAYESETPYAIKEPTLKMVVDCGAYDWVLFTDLFGTAFDLPKCLYPYPEDFYTHLINFGYSSEDAWNLDRDKLANVGDSKYAVSKIEKYCDNQKHNALWDAYILMLGYKVLDEGKKGMKSVILY